MGEIYVKKNNAFERVVSDGNTVIITGGGGGGSGVTIAFDAYRDASDPCIPYHTTGAGGVPIDGSATQTAAGPIPLIEGTDASGDNYTVHFRKLSKRLLTVGVNSNSLNSGQPFDQDGGTFTAPVAGVYKFDANVMLHMSENNASDGLFFYLWIRKNPSSGQITNVNTSRYGRLIEAFKDTEQAGVNDRADHMTTVSGTWDVELQAGDKIDLCAAWLITNQTGAEAEYGNCGRLSVNSVSFSGSYVGGASVTPANPVAFEAYVGGTPAGQVPNNGASNSAFELGSGNQPLRIKKGMLKSGAGAIQEYDPSNAFDPEEGTFTAPVKGIYRIGMEANIIPGFGSSSGDDGAFYFWIQKNPSNSTPSRGDALGTVAIETTQVPTLVHRNHQWTVALELGDKITWNVEGNKNGWCSNFVWQAHLLTSTQTIGVNTDVSFFARNEAASENALPDLALNTPYYLSKQQLSGSLSQTIVVQDNVNSCYSQTTGEFTAPISGMYEFEGRLSGAQYQNDGNSNAFVWFEKNAPSTPLAGADPYSRANRVSSVSRDGGSFAAATRFGASIKEHISLVGGDRIVLCGMGAGYAHNFDWSFSGKLLRRS